MDRCRHVGRLRLAADHSILNPQKWHCMDCNTTESVWACLGCAHVACGRYIEEHALQHFRQRRHPLAMEVNELYVFCYLCDDYVLNDNATGDLKLLRSTLVAIQSQHYEVTTRSGRTLRRPAADAPPLPPPQLRDEDCMFTALWHRRHSLMGRAFRLWGGLTEAGRRRQGQEGGDWGGGRRAPKRCRREEMESAPRRKSRRLHQQSQRAEEAAVSGGPANPRRTSRGPAPAPPPLPCPRRPRTQSPAAQTPKRGVGRPRKVQPSTQKPPGPPLSSVAVPGPSRPAAAERGSPSPAKRRPSVPPGVTGLRNLGNTCYMNSILQVLSHLLAFRECFLRLDLAQALQLLTTAVHVSAGPPQVAPRSGRLPAAGGCPGSGSGLGLSGGGGAARGRSMELIQAREPSSVHASLCTELHTLFQVMWSGRWALVSPFAMLHSVWRLIPAFRGYAQQDAQEFLCELLDKVQRELEGTGRQAPPGGSGAAPQRRLVKQVLDVVNTIFHGQLLSQVTCLACNHQSNTVEPFWDLSLEFPERYHRNGRDSATQASCRLTEMLAKFTETEALEGNIYACDQCNNKRRRLSSKPLILTEAQKQLTVHKLPQVLRLHLKRFRWSGRNHREKIGVHVSFDQLLNMEPYCCRDSSPMGGACRDSSPRGSATGSPLRPKHFLYDLSAVVMHHGKGFGSGHYTAYCYNTQEGFWVHCNDSKMNACSVEDVCRAQAYILFYTQRVAQDKDRPL